MIVDTCHSEATVAYDGFKPGPMGSRGLGQLAYDKGMRILAASKSGQSAVEPGWGHQGRTTQLRSGARRGGRGQGRFPTQGREDLDVGIADLFLIVVVL
jgi:hypothetical protein